MKSTPTVAPNLESYRNWKNLGYQSLSTTACNVVYRFCQIQQKLIKLKLVYRYVNKGVNFSTKTHEFHTALAAD